MVKTPACPRARIGPFYGLAHRLASRARNGGIPPVSNRDSSVPSPSPGSSFRRIVMLRRATRSLLWSSAAVLLPALAGAQGFALNEIGSCAIARGFATTGGACRDASLFFLKPPPTVQLPGGSALLRASPLMLEGTFTREPPPQG